MEGCISVKENEFVLVIGAGPIGLGTMQFAKAEGARVIAIYGLRVVGCELRAKRGHRAWGIAHRARHRSMEGAGGSKGLRE